MFVSVQSLAYALRISGQYDSVWGDLSATQVAFHPSRCCVAAAHRSELVIHAVQPSPVIQPTPDFQASATLSDRITSLCWAVFNSHPDPSNPWHLQRTLHITRSPDALPASRSSSPDDDEDAEQHQQRRHHHQQLLQHHLAAQREDIEECLLAGTADGFLHIISLAGDIILKQRIHSSAITSIQARCQPMGLHPEAALEDITITLADSVVRITALDLRAVLRACKLARATSVAVPPISYQRWELSGPPGPRSSAMVLGHKPNELYTTLLGSARSSTQQKLCIATAGAKPSLASYEAEERPQRSTLALLTGMASSIGSGVFSLGRSAISNVTYGPRAITSGLRSLISTPLGALYKPPPPAAAQHTHDDLDNAPRPEQAQLYRSLKDASRVATSMAVAPHGPLLAVADNLGRVLLVDAASMEVVRMWKGYRETQCGWLEMPSAAARQLLQQQAAAARCSTAGVATPSSAVASTPGSRATPAARGQDDAMGSSQESPEQAAAGTSAQQQRQQGTATGSPRTPEAGIGPSSNAGSSRQELCNALVLYAPKREVVEVWLPGSDTRLAALPVPGTCRLLPCQPAFGLAQALGQQQQQQQQERVERQHAVHVLECGTGEVWDVGERLVALAAC